MSWIKTIEYDNADSKLKRLYDRVKAPNGQIDNILKAHSLRPHSLTGHMTLYKNVLHHQSNTLPKWYLEAVGTYVSMLNECEYCVQHHFHGLKKLLNDDERADAIFAALQSRKLTDAFEEKWVAGLQYAEILTSNLEKMTHGLFLALVTYGFDDGEILELNQVTAYFNYANRTVLGLGVSIDGEILGLSPNDDGDEENWGHKTPE